MSYNPSAGAGVTSDMISLQIGRSTILGLTGVFQEIAFDLTETENDALVLEHNNTNTERVDIKTSGLHMIALNMAVKNTANQDKVLEGELRVNGALAQVLNFDITKTSTQLATRVITPILAGGTYLTIAFREGGGGTDLEIEANTKFVVTKLHA